MCAQWVPTSGRRRGHLDRSSKTRIETSRTRADAQRSGGGQLDRSSKTRIETQGGGTVCSLMGAVISIDPAKQGLKPVFA